MLFIIVCLLFSFSHSLLNVSCIFSILFPRFWIIFTIVTLNCFSSRLPFPLHLFVLVGFYVAPSSAEYFSVVSFCLTYCVWGSPFCRLQVHNSPCFWCLPLMGEVGSVACVGFLVEGHGSCILVGGSGSCLSGGHCHVWCCVLVCL